MQGSEFYLRLIGLSVLRPPARNSIMVRQRAVPINNQQIGFFKSSSPDGRSVKRLVRIWTPACVLQSGLKTYSCCVDVQWCIASLPLLERWMLISTVPTVCSPQFFSPRVYNCNYNGTSRIKLLWMQPYNTKCIIGKYTNTTAYANNGARKKLCWKRVSRQARSVRIMREVLLKCRDAFGIVISTKYLSAT